MRRFRRAAVFPKVHAASPRGFMDCAQLRQPTGSVRDRLTPPGPVQRGVTLYRCAGGGDALTGDKCCLRKWSGRHGRPYKLNSRPWRLSTTLSGKAAVKLTNPPAQRACPLWCLRQHLPPRESMSLDSQSPLAPYESSSFATPQAGPASGGTINREGPF